MKSKPMYRIGDKAQHAKQWATEWGVSYNSAYARLMTLCGKGKAEPVRQ